MAPARAGPNLVPAGLEFIQVTQQAQPPVRIPESDVTIEVFAEGPLRAEVTNVTRRLGRRQVASGGRNDYLPTILELIMLVEPVPMKPRGRSWTTVTALAIVFDDTTRQISVEYCLDKCALNKNTRAPHPQRKMIIYSATEAHVETRLSKRLEELEPFAERPAGRAWSSARLGTLKSAGVIMK